MEDKQWIEIQTPLGVSIAGVRLNGVEYPTSENNATTVEFFFPMNEVPKIRITYEASPFSLEEVLRKRLGEQRARLQEMISKEMRENVLKGTTETDSEPLPPHIEEVLQKCCDSMRRGTY